MSGEYNTQSAKGQLRKDWDELDEVGQPGDWAFLDDPKNGLMLLLRSPDGTERGWLSGLPLAPRSDGGPHWEWDGNREAPTLTPSINRLPDEYHPGWHGFMRAGRLESC